MLCYGEGSFLSSRRESDATDIDPDQVSYVFGAENVA